MGHFRKQMVSVLMTTRCNMKCVYCITSSNYYNDMDIDMGFAKKGISDYFSSTLYPYVRFVALGEPTVCMEQMKELHSYAMDISDGKAKFELQTNGFFNEKTAQWISENIEQVWLSFDGLPDVHDKLKVTCDGHPTSGIILRNLGILQERTSAGLRATITSLNFNRQEEMVEFASGQGVNAVFTKIMLPPSNPAHEHTFHGVSGDLGVTIMQYAQYFVKAWKLSRELGVFYGNGYINNFDEICQYACRACRPCPHLTPDGYVSACDRATLGTTPLDEYIYGKYDDVSGDIVYDMDKMKNLRARNVYNMEECRDCRIKFNCAGACLGTCSQVNGDMFKVIPEYCEAIKFMYDNIDWDPRDGLFPYFMT